MKYILLTAAMVVLIGFAGNGYAAKNEIYVIKVAGSINPGLSDFLKKGIEKASSDGVACIIIQLDTNDQSKAEAEAKEMCETLLANTVIEDYTIEIS